MKIVDFGFKKFILIIDKILSMLFKYIVSVVIEVVKMIVMILVVVVGIDFLMIYFKYWLDKFLKVWDLFSIDFIKFFSEIGIWGFLL